MGAAASKAPRILIVAGEASGDLHAANLIKAARELHPGLRFFGVGGQRMRQAGCDILVPAEDLAVMGLVEVALRYPVIRRAFKTLEKVLVGNEPPDLLVLVDYPGFNLRLAKVAHAAGVPVLYYICPKVWAWGRKRIPVIAENVDALACIFPFEPQLFAGTGLDARYVGNPLLDEERADEDRRSYLARLGFDCGQPVVGLFPGSRASEIRYIFETVVKTAARMRDLGIAKQFLLPVAPTLSDDQLRPALVETGLDVRLVRDNIYQVASSCDAALCVSGTVTLQAALARTPMAVLYKASPISYAVGRRLVKIDHFSLVNIVGGREIVREFLQDGARPELLAEEMRRLLQEPDYRRQVTTGLEEVCNRLGGPGTSRRVAEILLEMLTR
ncbi:MAG: lipid-A-disaccharide synthase [Deltaproteobacteria bacterium]|nr:MAG: lipid-A-disaccharide synthase [Deltaproteobacteria bacterium]